MFCPGADAFEAGGAFEGGGLNGGEGAEGFRAEDAVDGHAVFGGEVSAQLGEVVEESLVHATELHGGEHALGAAFEGRGTHLLDGGGAPDAGSEPGRGFLLHDILTLGGEGDEWEFAACGGDEAAVLQGTEEGAELGAGHVRQKAIGAEACELRGEPGALGAAQHVCYFGAAENGLPTAIGLAAAGTRYACQRLADNDEIFPLDVLSIAGLFGVADVAVAAIAGGGLAEVVENPALAAACGVCVAGDSFYLFVVAAGFFIDGVSIDRQGGEEGTGVEYACEARVAAGDIGAGDGAGVDEGRECGTDSHGVDIFAKLGGHVVHSHLQLAGVGIAAGAQQVVHAADGLYGGIAALKEELLGLEVGVVEKKFTDGLFAVAAGSACLLVVGLHAAGDFKVKHKAHIRAVYAHAEGVGCDHYVGSPGDEGIL